MEDRSIKVSDKTYKFLKELKKKTGLPIKRIIENFCNGDIYAKNSTSKTK